MTASHNMPTRPPAPSAAAKRQRAVRQRRRDGVRVFLVPAQEYETIEALIARGRITPAAALDDRSVGEALAPIIKNWVAERD
jgi:hypothetical protein